MDGVKYHLWEPPNEEEFERIIEGHAEEIFGEDAKYFDLKHKLASKSGTGSIPDGYVIKLRNKPEIQIIEIELTSHSLQHIIPQIVNIINGIGNAETQQKICNVIEDKINEDDSFKTKMADAIKPLSIHRFLSNSFMGTQTTLTIIIDKNSKNLEEAISKIASPLKIIEFQTFVREGVGLSVHAHLFEPVHRVIRSTPVILLEPIKISPIVSNKNSIEIIINNSSFAKFHLFYIPKDERHFFPGYKIPFQLETDLNIIETHVSSAPAGTLLGDPDKGSYFQSNLAGWFNHHSDLKLGDKVRITAIEPKKIYRLELV